MITYVSANQETTIDWTEVMNRLNKGELTYANIGYYANKSASWVTCACGNLCDSISREITGEPVDIVLFQSGIDFCDAWIDIKEHYQYRKSHSGYFNACKSRLITILNRIEQRSIELLKEMS